MIQDLFSMSGKTALVTGASSGLGAHFAKVLAQAGAKVILAARRIERLENVKSEVESIGGQAATVSMDVTQIESIEQAFDQAEQAFGTSDVLINNAGVSKGLTSFLEITAEEWRFTLNANLNGAFFVAQQATRRMLDAKITGCVVNVASMYGVSTAMRQVPYNISKTGLVQLTKNMALELGRKGIRVNALCPGYFPTEINEGAFDDERGQAYVKSFLPQRLGEVDELTGPLLLLASDAGSYINGTTLTVDGGTSLKPV